MNHWKLELEPRSSTPLYRQLYLHLQELILTGVLPSAERLPSSRNLAEQIGIGRITVIQAYKKLQAEGYVITRQGAGTFVADGLEEYGPTTAVAPYTPIYSTWGRQVLATLTENRRSRERPDIDFGFGRSFPHIFPYDIWRRLLARYLSTDDVMLSRYGSVAGFAPLRKAIADHLGRLRDLQCSAEQVIIVNGAQQALDILARLLLTPGDEVLVETPGYADAFGLFRLHRAKLTALPVDEQGLPVEKIPPDCQAKFIFVTPSHQFPRGGTMPVQRRLALLAWAQAHNALIIEDDYDGELRYDGYPLSALQSLDNNGRVVYLGTFSKVLFPALRLGYVVLPPNLVTPFVQAKGLVDRGAPTLTQAAIADFIAEGHFERHLRQLRKAYGQRRLTLIAAVDKYLSGLVSYTAVPAGLHVMLYLKPGSDEAALIQSAQKIGVGIYPGAPFHLQQPAPPSILLGFSGLTEAEIVEGVRRLSTLLSDLPGGS